jgi:hypothetical protein
VICWPGHREATFLEALSFQEDEEGLEEKIMTESKQTYTEPVSRLLELGDVRGETEWRDYRALGLTGQDVPQLCRLILDKDLFRVDSESAEVWSAIHAWRTLAQLEAISAIPALIELLGRVDEYDDDWTSDELPLVFAHLGQPALEPLRAFLADSNQGNWARIAAGSSLVKIGQRHPELRAEAVAVLTRQLANFAGQEPNFNGLLIGELVDLKAVEAAPVIEQAFAANQVDVMIQGDWEEVQIQLGMLAQRLSPPPDYRAIMTAQMGVDTMALLDNFRKNLQADPEFRAKVQLKAQRQAADKAKAKAKAKRKQAKKQRKRK